MNEDGELRNQLTGMLTMRQAHMDLTDALADFPAEHVNTKPAFCNYTFWHLLEHVRICQRDILDYIEADRYVWLTYPDDLWLGQDARTDAAGWKRSLQSFESDRKRLVEIVNDPSIDLFAPLPNSGEQRHTIVREIDVVSAHNSYHTGEFVCLRQALGIWPKN